MQGIFHTFAHEYSCQILFSPRNIPGAGLTDGEGCERFWALIRHLIPSLRTSSEYVRGQIITAVALHVAEGKKHSLPKAFLKSFHLALAKIQQMNKEVGEFCDNNDMTKESLQEQRSAMHAFFANPLVPRQDLESRICELLHVMQTLDDFDTVHRQNQASQREISSEYMNLRLRYILRFYESEA